MYRRPLPTSNLRFLSAVMWDGRASVPGHAVRDDLIAQDVVVGPSGDLYAFDSGSQSIVHFALASGAAAPPALR